MNRLLAIIFIILLFPTCVKLDEVNCEDGISLPVTNLIHNEKANRIAAVVCNTLNTEELLGIQVSIMDRLDESWDLSIGSTSLNQENALKTNHILRIGSVSKIYTATLIMRLTEEGFLQLDQEIAGFYPDLEGLEGIRVRDLLNHTSGIVDVFSIPGLFISSSNFPDRRWNPYQLAEDCLKKPLEFTPGSKVSYSNTNFIILGYLAEEVTGKPITELFDKYLFEPCGLNDTRLVPYMETPSQLVNGYVHHYALSLKEWYVNEPQNTAWSTIAFTAGSIVSTSRDLSSFVFQLFSGEILSSGSVDEMTKFRGSKGLGLFKFDVNGKEYWGHEGEITGFECITAYNPETGVVISICCNTTPFYVNDLLDEIDAEL